MAVIKFEKVQDSGVNVDEIVANLVGANPGKYAVAEGDMAELVKIKAALAPHGYACSLVKGEQTGTRRANKGANAGEDIPVFNYNLHAAVTQAEGQAEPGPVVPKARTPKAEAAPEATPEAAVEEAPATKGRKG